MTVEEFTHIFSLLPSDFEVRITGFSCNHFVLSPFEIYDIQVSYKKKMILISPYFPEQICKNDN